MASMNAITDSMYLANKKQAERKTGNNALGKDEFLKILMTQLQNQDPTNPMKDTEFIAQMAQFSSLEQMMNMTKAFESFAEGQQQTQLIQFSSFVGKQVKWDELTGKLDDKGKPIVNQGIGLITSIKFVNGSVQFTLADGKVITPGNISEVLSSGSNSNSLVEASMMIGRTVTYIPTATESGDDTDEEGEPSTETKTESSAGVTAQVESVSKKDGKIVFNLSDGTSITSDQIISIK